MGFGGALDSWEKTASPEGMYRVRVANQRIIAVVGAELAQTCAAAPSPLWGCSPKRTGVTSACRSYRPVHWRPPVAGLKHNIAGLKPYPWRRTTSRRRCTSPVPRPLSAAAIDERRRARPSPSDRSGPYCRTILPHYYCRTIIAVLYRRTILPCAIARVGRCVCAPSQRRPPHPHGPAVCLRVEH